MKNCDIMVKDEYIVDLDRDRSGQQYNVGPTMLFPSVKIKLRFINYELFL